MRKSRFFIILSIIILLSAIIIFLIYDRISPSFPFDGNRAYQDVITQVGFGPRIPDSQAHANTIAYIQEELRKASWQTKLQDTTWRGFSIKNIIASTTDRQPEIILGAHYDSRLLADQDPGIGQNAPVPGANDGASGVGILLELARSLPQNSPPIWLVFFDAEDNGGINGRDWILGSEAFVSALTFHPRAAIIIDMVGDANLDIYIERNSNATLVSEIWGQAARLGYEKQFIPTAKYDMLDDHTPFLEAGIPAVDIIDFDYPYWHTAADTPDKVSPTSLKIVGDTLRTWIINQK